MNHLANIRLLRLYLLSAIALLVFFGCREDRWENYTAEEKTEVMEGCQLLWPLEFKAKVTGVEYHMVNIKRLPRWINATVIDGEITQEVRSAMAHPFRIEYSFQDWPRIKVKADSELFHLFDIGDTMVKPRSSCSVINLTKPNHRVSVYYPFRHFP